MTDKQQQDKYSILFLNLIQQFYQSAMIFLGKIENPQSKKIEKNLDTAAYFIDTIDMIAAKTKGNLASTEEAAIQKILQELKLIYVNEKENKK